MISDFHKNWSECSQASKLSSSCEKKLRFFIRMGKTSHFVFCPIKECGKNAHTPGPTFLSLRENKGAIDSKAARA